MLKYIDAKRVIDHYKELANIEWNKRISPVSLADAFGAFIEYLEGLPAADIQEVKHGHWIYERNFQDYSCSECGAEAPNDGYDCGAPYCYICGARMDGDAKKIPFTKYINGSVNVEKEVIDAMPSADVQKVRHGRWVEYGLEEREGEVMYLRCFRCSECNYNVNGKFKFCPNCGAKMDGDEE